METKVKICGIKNMEEVNIVNKYLPDYIGFVFAQSSRIVSLDIALRLSDQLDLRIKRCGVFKDETLEKIIEISNIIKLDVIQLHGKEDDAFVSMIKNETDAKIWKAGHYSYNDILNIIDIADKVLLDSRIPGSGKRFNWDSLDILKKYMDNIIIAGGLDHVNVKELIRRYDPFCVDVSTRVEKEGIKDEFLVRSFIECVRGEE